MKKLEKCGGEMKFLCVFVPWKDVPMPRAQDAQERPILGRILT
jgi:hypothetical protein